jgi:PKD repeat protein
MGEVDLTVDLGSGARPYNYSDMTGAVVVGSTSPQGFWTVVQDSQTPGFAWGRIIWNTEAEGSEPAGTAIVVEARTADTEAGLGGQNFQPVVNGELFSMSGRFIEVRVTLKANLEGDSPVLSDIRIQPSNRPPTIISLVAPTEPGQINQAINATVTFEDPDPGDTHTATWDWGDGSTSTLAAILPSNSASHIYTTPGVYILSVTITDAAGASDTEIFQYIVVYDPDGGFVTGGGWIWSPQGAYTPDPSLTGKATFGFVSKYQKGAKIPTGNTEFQFKVANLNFKSISYEWLVIAGARAQYKGIGTINGMGEYGFILTAIDGQVTGGGGVDKFRIKIWDKATGEVIYDNQLGSRDTADPTTVIQGGSIVIHKAK